MNEIKAAWKGEVKLWKVFWLYNFILGSALIYAMDYAGNFGLVVEIVVYLIVLIWVVWIVVALWRCAFNASWKGWGYITRGLLVVCLALSLLTIIAAMLGIDIEAA